MMADFTHSDGTPLYTARAVMREAAILTTIGVGLGALGMFMLLALGEKMSPPASPLLPGEAYGRTRITPTPPIEFTNGVEVRVRFTTIEEIRELCSADAYACWDYRHERIVMPNPCYNGHEGSRSFRYMARYQESMCHEIGHVNGWLHESIEERAARIEAERHAND